MTLQQNNQVNYIYSLSFERLFYYIQKNVIATETYNNKGYRFMVAFILCTIPEVNETCDFIAFYVIVIECFADTEA